MSWKKVFAVIRREYLERVRTKAFWIGTFLIPIFFIGYIAIQVIGSRRASGERRVAVVDLTRNLYPRLTQELARQERGGSGESRSRGIHWILEQRDAGTDLERTKEKLRREVLAKKINGYLVLDPALLEKDRIDYFSVSVSEFVALSQLERAVNQTLLKDRIARRGLPPELSNELDRRVDLKAFKVTQRGVSEEKGAGFFAAIMFMIIMYMTFFMYGIQNMKGVIDAQTNRDRARRPDAVSDLVAGRDEPLAPVDRGNARRRRHGRADDSDLDDRLLPALLRLRVLPLREHLHGDRSPVQHGPGGAAALDDSRHVHRGRVGGLPGDPEQPERRHRDLRVALSVDVSTRDVHAHRDRRAAGMADRSRDHDPRNHHGADRVGGGSDLPRRHPHVRKETDATRDHAVGPVSTRKGAPASDAAGELVPRTPLPAVRGEGRG
jgi:hypothetical protein